MSGTKVRSLSFSLLNVENNMWVHDMHDEWLCLCALTAGVMGRQTAWFLTVMQSWWSHRWITAGMGRPVTGGVWTLLEVSISSTITWRTPEKPRAPLKTPPTARGSIHYVALHLVKTTSAQRRGLHRMEFLVQDSLPLPLYFLLHLPSTFTFCQLPPANAHCHKFLAWFGAIGNFFQFSRNYNTLLQLSHQAKERNVQLCTCKPFILFAWEMNGTNNILYLKNVKYCLFE